MADANVPKTNIARGLLFWKLARRNIVFYRKQNVLLCAGCAVSAAILIGALLVGASLRESLREIQARRLGNVEWVLSSPSGYFRTELADTLTFILTSKLHQPAPVWPTMGSVGIAGGNERVHRVNIVGVDIRFWWLNPWRYQSRMKTGIGDNSAIINSALAKKLGVKIGDDIVIHFQSTKTLAMEAPFGQRDNLITHRLTVEGIADKNDFGDFNLRAEHFKVYNIFVPLKFMQMVNDMADMTPMILIGGSYLEPFGEYTYDEIMHGKGLFNPQRSVQNQLRIKDAGLNIRTVYNDSINNNNTIEIYSDRVFISEQIKKTIINAVPNATPLSTWFVNSINKQNTDRSTPYSFVSTNHQIGNNDIMLNRWTANDLGASVGDTVTMTYFVPRQTSGLRIDTATFVVSGIIEMDDKRYDKTLMPPYPGLEGAESCTDWDPSIPVDLSRIRPEDEEYWEKYAGTPKAIISYDRAMEIWGNRFGITTAIRVSDTNKTVSIDDIESAIQASLTPSLCGIQLTNVRAAVNKAINNGIDFAPLFMGLSFFTLAAALLLIWLLSSLHIKSRAEEHRILKALGYKREHILMIYLAEGIIIFSAGVIIGAVFSLLYTSIIIWALKTVWSPAAQVPDLVLRVDILSIITGGALAFVCALVSMTIPMLSSQTSKNKRAKPIRSGILTRYLSSRTFDERHLILRNILRDKKRVAGEIMILACALVILGTTQLFHHKPVSDPSLKSSGTGGFYWYGELDSGIPAEETNANFLRERGIDIDDDDFASIPMRVKDGDDASCLNLNQTESPALVGVDQKLLDRLGAFSFASIINISSFDKRRPWRFLGLNTYNENTIYGIADANTIEWGLGKSPGDTLTYINERGDTLNVVLAAALKNSVMQGKVMIAESDFVKHYPSISGYRLLLLSPPAGRENHIAEVFRAYHDRSGLRLESTVERLNAFGAVENTYLSIFALLGMMGLALGCAGLGIIIARNIEERRHELAAMTAQGFGIGIIKRLLFKEHAAIAAAGTAAGLLPAFIVSMAAGSGIAGSSIPRIICLTAIVLSCGAGSIVIGLRRLRGDDLIEILKTE